jgi:hypothetical protein
MSAIIWVAILLGGTLHDYEDGWTDGYCQAVADDSHGWRIDEVPHTDRGFVCVWSVPRAEGHHEHCSDAGGSSWVEGDRMHCKRIVTLTLDTSGRRR